MITTDTGAKKIEGTDNWRQIFSAHNDSVDAYDANVAALQDALGIVVDGNKSAVAASTGQFIILKNSSIVDSGSTMLADGLYTAAKAIPANTVIDKTYLTADANGGLNALNSKLTEKTLIPFTVASASSSSYSIDNNLSYETVNAIYIYVVLKAKTDVAASGEKALLTTTASIPRYIPLNALKPGNTTSCGTALLNSYGTLYFTQSAVVNNNAIFIVCGEILK